MIISTTIKIHRAKYYLMGLQLNCVHDNLHNDQDTQSEILLNGTSIKLCS
jgi:hypothetical protein